MISQTDIKNSPSHLFIMYGIQSKITRHAKRREKMTHYEEKNQLIKTNQELPEMLELGKVIKQLLLPFK